MCPHAHILKFLFPTISAPLQVILILLILLKINTSRCSTEVIIQIIYVVCVITL